MTARPAVARLAVYSRPGGRVIARIGRRTEFGSPVVLGVVAVRAARAGLGAPRTGWAAVITSALPNGRLGWVRERAVRLARARYSIEVDLAEKTLTVRRGRGTLRAFAVDVGGARSPTPLGTYVVTDELTGDGVYGCCILALSGRQPHPPPGWNGGTRLAIHGGALGAGTAGCVHADEGDLRYLMATVPLGTPVTIHA
jgi:lipoprotein-anchoring transpeptidase ErfK/SrfK